MFSAFRRRPKFHDEALADLAAMLTEDVGGAVPRRELLQPDRLDYSVGSLRHIDEYLEALRSDRPTGDDLLKVELRSGAYVGEVIRRHSAVEAHWIDHDAAAEEAELVRELGRSLDTAAVLRAGSDASVFRWEKWSGTWRTARKTAFAFLPRSCSTNGEPSDKCFRNVPETKGA